MKKILKALSKNSLLHGAYVAAGTTIASSVIPMVQSGTLSGNYKEIVGAGVTAGIIYVLKNIFAGSSEKLK